MYPSRALTLHREYYINRQWTLTNNLPKGGYLGCGVGELA